MLIFEYLQYLLLQLLVRTNAEAIECLPVDAEVAGAGKDKSRPTFSPPHPVDGGGSGSGPVVVEAAARQLALEHGRVLEKKRKFTFSPILPTPASIIQHVRTVSQSAPCSPKHFSESHSIRSVLPRMHFG